eukprot:TRINITY_DN1480_c0_g1_i1.p1 TRINITY_DN1480_c0_g1~~TRINITY_DN1480_c0_g1_i1.p1  ORF type:complete len:246 (+),score=103.57 TRINITY_DN1480_c0_g1_i1:552-1289(+)
MFNKSFTLFCLLFVLILANSFEKVNSLRCGTVSYSVSMSRLDGTAAPHLSISWSGYEDQGETLTYDWSLVSANKAEKLALRSKGDICRKHAGFEGIPDLVDWTSSSNYEANADKFNIKPDEGYYFVLRISNGEQTLYSNTEVINVDEINKQAVREVEDVEGNPTRIVIVLVGSSVVFSFIPTLSISGGDDDDDLEDWEIGLIAMGCFLFLMILLAVIVVALAQGKGDEDDKYRTNVQNGRNNEDL